MKKIIAILLCLFVMLPAFAGCSNTSDTPAAGSNLTNAKDYLINMYQPDSKDKIEELRMDKDVLSVVTVDGVSYNVTWTVTISKGSADAVVIGKSDKANHVLIDIPDLPEEDIEFTATATVKDASGKTESANFKYKIVGVVMPGLTDAETVEEAYKLADGESLEDEATITGTVTSIETPWNETDKTVTVKIQVEDLADKLLLCPGLVVESADAIAVGDSITVIGYLTNNKGSIEFKAGCKLDAEIPDNEPGTTEPDKPGTDEPDTNTTTTANGTTGTTATTKPGATTKPTTKPTSGSSDKVPTTMAGMIDAAVALGDGGELPYTSTLTGKVIGVNEAYSSEFKNITVTIQVTGRENNPVKCYRLKGTDVDKIVKGDTLTVTGTLKNYRGAIELVNCTLDKRVATQTTIKQETDPEKIMAAAKKLTSGEDLGYDVTLRGEVVGLDSAYDPNFENISVVIKVAGSNLLCYRMVGKDVDKVLVGDTITVTGRIKNYNGTIEFGQGCTMLKREAGEAVILTEVKDIIEAAFALEPGASLPHDVTLTGKITEINTPYAAAYKNITVTIVVDGFDKYPLKCYRMKAASGDAAETEALKVGDVITVTGIIKNYQHSSGDCEVEFNTGCLFVKN